MRTTSNRATIIWLISLLFSMLFLYTGIIKFYDYQTIKEQMAITPLLAPVSSEVASWLPWVELSTSLLLMVPRWRLKGLFATLILMSGFTLYIIDMMTFDKYLPCSCGGIIETLTWAQHLCLNIALLFLAIAGICMEKNNQKFEKKQLARILAKQV